jgi:glycosyltransferase involved in cell wall biosynthesis
VLLAEAHPWPPTGGIALRNAANAAALAGLGPLAVVGAGDRRGWHRPSALGEATAVGLGHPPHADPDGWRHRPSGHPSDGRWDRSCEAAWRDLLRRWRPDVVVIEQLWLHHGRHAARMLDIPVVLDAHNVERDVDAAIAAAAPLHERARADLVATRTAALEARVLGDVDQVWACSRRDRAALEAGGRPARVVPNAVDVARVRMRDERHRPPQLTFPASFAYPPNTDAARVLVDEILPAFERLVGAARVSLVGRDPPRWMRRLAETDRRVEVTGAVPDTHPWLERATALVVPLAAGSGTRFKVLEAMALGVPVVSTPKGVEGLGVVDGTHVHIGSDGPELARLAAQVHRDGAAALVRSARHFVEARYGWDAVAAAIERHLGAVDRCRGRPLRGA